jgi:flavin reductase (DIM6/NTAB) family NADH-FMN oxidoreductase RutF
MSPPAFDSAKFRQVLGHFPTGVTVITAANDGVPVGMAVGSFASVSLEPPLVAFFPDRSSSSWPKIQTAGAFCVNMLGDDQEEVCRRFAMKGDDKFAGLGWSPAGSGSPLLDGVIAWIDCDIESVTDAGDHFFVLGRVRELEVGGHDRGPLVFFRGGYGRFEV